MFPTVYLCFLPSGDWDSKLPEAEIGLKFPRIPNLPSPSPIVLGQEQGGPPIQAAHRLESVHRTEISKKDEGTITGKPGTVPVALKVCANISRMRKLVQRG